MTFRAGKKHKVQDSGKSSRNFVKLASRLQRFLNTGKASKQDLKAIDDQFYSNLREQCDKILQLLDQLKDRVPKAKGREDVESTCLEWASWLSEIDSKGKAGYSGARRSAFDEDTHGAILESAVDADSDLFKMLIAFNSFLSTLIRKASYEAPESDEISASAKEIFGTYETREKILTKISGGLQKAQQPIRAADTELKAK